MAEIAPFARNAKLPSWFANRIQDFLSGAPTDLVLSRADATHVQVVPREPFGISAIALQGYWRYNSAAVNRVMPGGAAGIFDVWAVATAQAVDDTPDPFTDHTNYAFDLRVTNHGVNPSGTGVDIFEKIGEADWDGSAISGLRQTYAAVAGAALLDGAIGSSGRVSATRQPDGSVLLDLVDDSVTAAKIAPDAVGTSELAPDAVTATEIAAGAVGSSEIGTDAVGSDEIAADAVGSPEIAADAVGSAEIAADAVGSSEIATDAVTAAEIAPDAVGASELADNAVDTPAIQAGAVTGPKIAADAVGPSQIAADAVGSSEIAADAVGASEIAPDAVGSSELANGAVDSAAIQNDAVGSAAIAADSVGASEIAPDSVTAAEIAPNAVGSSELADNAVDTAALQADSVTAAKIGNDQVGASEIATDAVGSAEIAANAVGSSELADGGVTNPKLSLSSIGGSIAGLGVSDLNVTGPGQVQVTGSIPPAGTYLVLAHIALGNVNAAVLSAGFYIPHYGTPYLGMYLTEGSNAVAGDTPFEVINLNGSEHLYWRFDAVSIGSGGSVTFKAFGSYYKLIRIAA